VAFYGYENEVINLLSRIEKNVLALKPSVQRTPPAIRRQRELRKLESVLIMTRLVLQIAECWRLCLISFLGM